MLYIGLLLFFTYPLLPFSGTHNERAGTLVIERRYLILPFTIGIVLLAPMIRGTSRARTFLIALMVLGVMTGWSASPEASAVAAVCGIAALMFWDTAVTMRIPRAVWTVLGIAALLAGPRLLSAKQRMTASSLSAWGEQTRPIGQAWTAIDRLPRGARIASFGPSSYQYYALFGRSLQLIPVGLDSSGKPWRPLYDEWKDDPAKAAWWAEDEEPQAASFASNLLASRVQYVLVSKWDGTRWPPQQRILEQTAGATMVYHDGYSTIWQIGF
jgi:hypothetical protein